MECGLQLPWRKHYSVLDFLTSSAFVGMTPKIIDLLKIVSSIVIAHLAAGLRQTSTNRIVPLKRSANPIFRRWHEVPVSG
jgi:hypothetical protein